MTDILFWGKRGSGKTLGAIFEAYLDWFDGHEIWSNTPLNNGFDVNHVTQKKGNYHFIDTIDLIKESFSENLPSDDKQRTCIIDETHTQADSRTSGSHINRQLVNFVTQARKRNFRILYTSQILTGYDVRMRALTDRVVRCLPTVNHADLGWGNANYPEPTDFQYISYIPEEDWRMENSYSIPRALARKLYPLYKTDAPIMPVEVRLAELKEQ